MQSTRNYLRDKTNSLFVIPFDDRPGKLFNGLQHCCSVIAMHDRILLRRVGGGWIFVHRILQEYFAGLAEAPK